MIINRLEMYNFRQYIGHQSVDFSTDPDKNVTVLIGINTSGKTTIVRAFEWCLYGKNGFEDPVLLNSEVRANMNVGMFRIHGFLLISPMITKNILSAVCLNMYVVNVRLQAMAL